MPDKKHSILIAEDEASLLDALADKFKQAQFTVTTASDGEIAWRMVQENHPDFLLLDILMPKMSGLDVLAQVRQTAWGKKIPVMILSNISDEPRATEAARTDQFCSYFTKSTLTIEDVIAKVKEQLLSADK